MTSHSKRINIREFVESDKTTESRQEKVRLNYQNKRFSVNTTITTWLELAKIDNKSINVHYSLKFPIKLKCDRCLEDFDHRIDLEFDQIYSTSPDDDEERLKNNQIDIVSAIKDEIVVDLPIKAICQQSCKGLCQNCGQNLNISECDCENVSTGHPELQKLAKLKEDNNKDKNKK